MFLLYNVVFMRKELSFVMQSRVKVMFINLVLKTGYSLSFRTLPLSARLMYVV